MSEPAWRFCVGEEVLDLELGANMERPKTCGPYHSYRHEGC